MSDISARLDRLGFTGFHKRLLLIGGLGYMFDAMDVAIIGFVLPIVTLQWHLSGAQAGLIAASSAMGGIIGALLAGRLGDIYGRRLIMMWALAIYTIASMISAFAWDSHFFLAARVIAGIGTSAESVIIAPFLAEFAPARFRGRYTGALTGFFSFGYIAAAVLGWALVPAGSDGWRWALALTAAPVFLLLWWRRSLPESPRWLERQGRHREADAIVSLIEAETTTRPSDGPIAAISAVSSPILKGRVSDLLSKALRRRTLVALVLWGAIGFCYYAFMTWIPSLLVARGMSVVKSFGFSIAIYAAQAPGYFSAAWLNDKLGRKAVITLYLSLAACAASFLALGTSELQVLGASLALSFAMNGAYSGLYSYTPELFPTAVRATAQGIATATSRVGAMLSPILVGTLFPVVGFAGVFGTAVLVLAVGALTVLLFGPSTRGRSLGDIE
jgi:putative MFS transporter